MPEVPEHFSGLEAKQIAQDIAEMYRGPLKHLPHFGEVFQGRRGIARLEHENVELTLANEEAGGFSFTTTQHIFGTEQQTCITIRDSVRGSDLNNFGISSTITNHVERGGKPWIVIDFKENSARVVMDAVLCFIATIEAVHELL